MMVKMFKSQLGKNIKVYIDDMVVKSKVESEHINNLKNIFEILRKHKLHLNAAKCSFGIGSGKFLSYMVTHRGIEVDHNQIRAIDDLQSPWNPKEVQKWRVCVDFTDLNKAYPKDHFPLPQIDQLVDATRRNSTPSSNELFGRLSGLSLDIVSSRRSGKDCFSYTH